MVAVACFDKAAIVSDIRYCTLCLFTGCCTEICPVLGDIFLCMDINAGYINIRKYLLMCKPVIPCKVVKSLSVCKVILLCKL